MCEDRLKRRVNKCLEQMNRYERGSSKYEVEKIKLIEVLYEYASRYRKDTADGKKTIDNIGLEVVETAERCLNTYKSEDGEFLHYYSRSLKHAAGKTKERIYNGLRDGGMHFPEGKRREIKSAIRIYQDNHGKHDLNNKDLQIIADSLGENLSVVVRFCESVRSSDEVLESRDGDDQGASWIEAMYLGAVDTAGQNIRVTEELDVIQAVYEQEMAKKTERGALFSKLITRRLLERGTRVDLYIAHYNEYSFMDKEMIEATLVGQALPMQKDIAAQFGKLEAAISRYMKEFEEEIREEFEREE